MVWPGLQGGPGWLEVRFHEGSTRVPAISSRAGVVWFEEGSTNVPDFHQNSARVSANSARAAGWAEVV